MSVGIAAEDIGLLTQCGSTLILPCRRGPMMVNRHDQVMTFALAIYGEFGEDELEVLGQWLKPGMHVIDVGANIGVHSLAFSKMVSPGGSVISLEPIMCNFNLLCANIAMSSQQNIYPQRTMAGKETGTRMLTQIDSSKAANFGSINAKALEVLTGVPTPEVTIDWLDVKKCDLIKIDVEGSELDVLEGAVNTITKFKPLLQVECSEGDDNEAAIQALLRSHGYETYWLYNRLFRPNNYKCSDAAQHGQDRNILAVQPAHKHITEGLEICSLLHR